MTSDDAVDIKEVIFLNDGVGKDYVSLPEDVTEAFDQRLTTVQNLGRLPRDQHESLSGSLKGIDELRVSYDKNTYRTYYGAQYREVIVVLDAGIKKSKKGGEIPKEQVERLIERKRAADQLYEQHKDFYAQRYNQRERNRSRQQHENKTTPRHPK